MSEARIQLRVNDRQRQTTQDRNRTANPTKGHHYTSGTDQSYGFHVVAVILYRSNFERWSNTRVSNPSLMYTSRTELIERAIQGFKKRGPGVQA